MDKSKVLPTDGFSLAPMLALLPVKSQIGALEKLTSFFYARFEKVSAIRKELEIQADSEGLRRILSEQGMLKQVLEWLEVSTDLEVNKQDKFKAGD